MYSRRTIATIALAIVAPAASAQAPGAFGKVSPANGATGVPTSLTLSWAASTGATSYESRTVTGICSAWTSVGTSLSVDVSGLGPSTQSFWQVRANNAAGTTYADGGSGALWSFTTLARPGPFTKTSPTDYATGQPTSLTLSWAASSGATSYQYCYDTTNDSACSAWTSAGTALNAAVSGLATCTTYYWQIRANGPGGTTYGDGSSTSFRRFSHHLPAGGVRQDKPGERHKQRRAQRDPHLEHGLRRIEL